MHAIILLFMASLAAAAPREDSPYQDVLAQLAEADASAGQDPEQAVAALLEALVDLA